MKLYHLLLPQRENENIVPCLIRHSTTHRVAILLTLCFEITNTHLVSKNISESSNSLAKSDFSPGNMELDEVSGEITDGPISPDIASRVSCTNEEMAFSLMETLDASEIANAVAGPSGIRPHRLQHAGEKRFTCILCHIEFSESWDFDIHYGTHTGEKPFACELCKRVFTRKGDLNKHYRTHTGEKPFVCDICHKGFSQKAHLNIHYRTHTGEKPFVCEVCKRGFNLKGDLNRHYRTHTGEKPFVCELCIRGFSLKGDLYRHYRTHTGERPFVCELCKRRFTLKEHLDKHYRTHTGEKPFVCDICQKGFSWRAHLDTHYQTHTGKKPFVCEVCKRGFTQKGHLDKHYRTHTVKLFGYKSLGVFQMGFSMGTVDRCRRQHLNRYSLIEIFAPHLTILDILFSMLKTHIHDRSLMESRSKPEMFLSRCRLITISPLRHRTETANYTGSKVYMLCLSSTVR
ncbi:Histone-lysine N-methyltransferase PRDM9 [Araneus ventricosus]|uniref:Histone-lysine N-methyltransferase PRDM9 n=1 Tax=Araneus ventricosus TaxID=182803 RepID=A0A4Y2V4Z9_ARAVE|nr:Histone-lysine N-methyltransferase PRDM9 [Araneus ventricosus]